MTEKEAPVNPARLKGQLPESIEALRDTFSYLAGKDGNLSHGHTPDEIRSDNHLRASWAARALFHYADFTMGGGNGESCETVISDLLCDLMHLCDALDLSFDGLADKARGHHLPELTGEL